MSITWSEVSTEVLDRAERIIRIYHSEFMGHISIAFVFRSEAAYSGGMTILAKCAKVQPKLRPYLDYDIIIWIAEDEYEKLSSEQRDALIDHELCHIKYNISDEKIFLRGHDFEEFYGIIQRYGFWNKSLHHLATQAGQLRLPISATAVDAAQALVKSVSGNVELAVMDNVEVEA
jgi:predicted metallopeptidase